MALTPQSNDAFFREVDDEVRRERVEHAARRYGVIVAIAVVVALAAFAAVLAWRSHRETVAGDRGEQFTGALSSLSAGKEADARKSLDALAATDTKGYAPMARITLADILVKNGKDAEAAAAFMKVAGDSSVPQQIRDLATIRATSLDFDRLAPDEVVNRLKPLAVTGNAWFGSAGEITAIALIKLNRPKDAGAMLVSMTRDQTVPRTIRARAAQLAGNLGFDAVQPSDSAQS